MAAKIMIVDDELEVVRLLEVILSRAGYRVGKAYSGKDCLAMLSRESPDVILLDIMMPGMSGIEVMERMRSVYDVLSMPPVVLLTAKGGMEAMLEGLQAGAFKFLVKPTSREKLLETVKAAVEYRESKRHPAAGDEFDWV